MTNCKHNFSNWGQSFVIVEHTESDISIILDIFFVCLFFRTGFASKNRSNVVPCKSEGLSFEDSAEDDRILLFDKKGKLFETLSLLFFFSLGGEETKNRNATSNRSTTIPSSRWRLGMGCGLWGFYLHWIFLCIPQSHHSILQRNTGNLPHII